MATILTERLRLTPLVPDDADEMAVVLGDERMHQFTGGEPLALDELRARYDHLALGHSPDGSQLWWNWIVRLDVGGQAVGAVQATVAADGSAADVAWEVGVPWQGRGIASEAVGALVHWLSRQGVGELRACIHPGHRASAGVAASAGFVATAEILDGEIVWRRG